MTDEVFTTKDLLSELKALIGALDKEDDKYRIARLKLMINQIKAEMIVGSFDPLKDLESVTVVNLSKIRELTAAAKQAVKNAKRRAELADRVIDLAKKGLTAAGIPLPLV